MTVLQTAPLTTWVPHRKLICLNRETFYQNLPKEGESGAAIDSDGRTGTPCKEKHNASRAGGGPRNDDVR